MDSISVQSFDALPHNLRECFLDMALFLEDQRIIASSIIDLWSALYGKESFICMNYLQDLASHNLLKLLPLGYVTFPLIYQFLTLKPIENGFTLFFIIFNRFVFPTFLYLFALI